MLFNLEIDSGDSIIFYVVPDTYSETPSVRFTSGGIDIYEMMANETRDALVSAGRHETGRCGFNVNSEMIPNLQNITDLAIYEKETGLLILRRQIPDAIRKKLFRLDAGYAPMYTLDRSLSQRFQYSARNLEVYGLETVSQLFLMSHIDSIYLSGRILYHNYVHYIDGNYDTFICIDDPYFQLAERLLVLAKFSTAGKLGVLGERDALLLKPAADFAVDLHNKKDSKGLRWAFRNLPQEVALAFVNPITRMLTSSTVDELPRRGAVATAFDTLASFMVVGIRNDPLLFQESVAAMLGIDPNLVAVPPPLAGVSELAQILRDEAHVEQIIESDLELYAQLCQAYEKI